MSGEIFQGSVCICLRRVDWTDHGRGTSAPRRHGSLRVCRYQPLQKNNKRQRYNPKGGIRPIANNSSTQGHDRSWHSCNAKSLRQRWNEL